MQYLISQTPTRNFNTGQRLPRESDAEAGLHKSDPLFKPAFRIYQQGYPANEFVGLPAADH